MTTETKTPPTEAETDALRGPWIATLSEPSGFLVDIDDVDDYEYLEVAVTRRTAAPTARDGGIRMPGRYDPADVLYRDADFDDDEDAVRRAWVRAQAVAAALNAADGPR